MVTGGPDGPASCPWFMRGLPCFVLIIAVWGCHSTASVDRTPLELSGSGAFVVLLVFDRGRPGSDLPLRQQKVAASPIARVRG
jgi:hypothetical protein